MDSGLSELRIPGEVLGNVTSRGKNVIITGTVRGDVTLTRGIVELGPESEVGGRVYAVSYTHLDVYKRQIISWSFLVMILIKSLNLVLGCLASA